jgi:hypothetical protein
MPAHHRTSRSPRRAQALTLASFVVSDGCRSRCWAPLGSVLLNQLADARVRTFAGLLTWLRQRDGPPDFTREYWAGRTRRAAAEELWRRYLEWRVAERVQRGMMPHPPARRKPAPTRKTHAPFTVIEGSGGRRPRRSWPPPL